jgi:BirA family biotin operon repressor/biotin-[acetyl-CoA-carboxylase] ligase
MDAHNLKIRLNDLAIPHVRYFDQIGSTNDVALDWLTGKNAEGKAVDGCLVVANHQTKGRGRLGRRWITEPGAALAFSLIVRPTPAEAESLALFSPLGALAISQALENLLNLTPQIKWPNDLLLNRRKAAGILVEVAWLGDLLEGLVLGIGLNVAPHSVPPAELLLFPATSVEDAAQQPVDRVDLLHAILESIFYWRLRLLNAEFFDGWQTRLAFKDEWVRLDDTGREPILGKVLGIGPSGSLLLRTQSGETQAVSVGDVHLRLMDE